MSRRAAERAFPSLYRDSESRAQESSEVAIIPHPIATHAAVASSEIAAPPPAYTANSENAIDLEAGRLQPPPPAYAVSSDDRQAYLPPAYRRELPSTRAAAMQMRPADMNQSAAAEARQRNSRAKLDKRRSCFVRCLKTFLLLLLIGNIVGLICLAFIPRAKNVPTEEGEVNGFNGLGKL